jgi:hypothetical protein
MTKRMMLGGWAMAVVMSVGAGGLLGGEGDMKMPARAKNDVFDAIRGLSGTWVATKTDEKMPMGDKPLTLVFKETSAGSAVMETMFGGTDHEMVNMYTVDGKNVVLTHYCAMGNQPRMKAAAIDKGVVKFEYVDGGNLKSRDDGHMDSVEMTIDGDKLIEKWSMYHDGQVMGTTTFEFKKQK